MLAVFWWFLTSSLARALVWWFHLCLFSFLQEIDGLKSLMAECPEDKDMLDMVTEELGQAMEEEKRLQSLLLKSLLPKDDADERDSILEVRAGNKPGKVDI